LLAAAGSFFRHTNASARREVLTSLTIPGTRLANARELLAREHVHDASPADAGFQNNKPKVIGGYFSDHVSFPA
jgi:hypothetical protein